MTGAQLFRASGLALIAGAIAFILHIVLRSILTAGAQPAAVYQEPIWVPVSLLGVIGAVLVMLGLPGTYARIASSAGWLGLIGIALVALAWMFFGLFLSLFSLLLAPWLSRNPPESFGAAFVLPSGLIVAFIVALIANLGGAILLAIPFLLYRTQPRWAGYALPLSALWTLVGDLVAPSGPARNFVVNLISNLGVVLLLIALAGIAAPVWSSPSLRLPSLQGGAGESVS